jgi:hypothetical protein
MAPLPKTVLKRMQDWLKENFTEVWEEEVCPPSSPDCNPFDYFVWGISVLSVIAEFGVGKRSNTYRFSIQCPTKLLIEETKELDDYE